MLHGQNYSLVSPRRFHTFHYLFFLCFFLSFQAGQAIIIKMHLLKTLFFLNDLLLFCFRSLSDLTRCVDRRIEKSCGQQATSQFYALLKSKVPGQLAEICPINTTNVSPSPSAGSVPSKSLVATVAMTTACVALIRHVV